MDETEEERQIQSLEDHYGISCRRIEPEKVDYIRRAFVDRTMTGVYSTEDIAVSLIREVDGAYGEDEVSCHIVCDIAVIEFLEAYGFGKLAETWRECRGKWYT